MDTVSIDNPKETRATTSLNIFFENVTVLEDLNSLARNINNEIATAICNCLQSYKNINEQNSSAVYYTCMEKVFGDSIYNKKLFAMLNSKDYYDTNNLNFKITNLQNYYKQIFYKNCHLYRDLLIMKIIGIASTNL